MRTQRLTFALVGLVASAVGCAGIVGISDVPDGPDGADGGHLTLPDGSVVLPDGAIVLPDGAHVTFPDVFVPPGQDGGTPGSDVTTKAGDAGAFTYQPSNIGGLTFDGSSTGPLTMSSDNCVLYTDEVTISCDSGQNPPMDMFTVTLADGAGQAQVFAFTYISIDADSALQIRGMMPAIIIALGSVDLEGSIDVSADNYDSDSDINVIVGSRETGPGVGAFGNSGGPQGGGGGSFCGTGGTGAGTGGFAPGAPYGSADLIPLWGGSAGGGASAGGADGFANGHGGGVIQISAAGSITVHAGASINANGSGGIGQGNEQGEGAGSGGGILLEGVTLQIDGVLEANGGEGSDMNSDGAIPPGDGGVATQPSCVGGNGSAGATITGSNGGGGDEVGEYGGGGGGAGYIRLNGTNVTVTGTVSPAIGSSCATQGALP